MTKARQPLVHAKSTLSISEQLLLWPMCVLVFLTPLESFSSHISVVNDFTFPALVGYLVLPFVAWRVRGLVQASQPFLWLWIAAFFIGTVLALYQYSGQVGSTSHRLPTTWQMTALMWFVMYAAGSQQRLRTLTKAFVVGLGLTLVAYAIMYAFELEVIENENRVVGVAGFQANQAGLAAVLTILLVVGTANWWSLWSRRVLLFGLGPVAAYVLVLSNSRVAQLSLGVGMLAAFLGRSANSQRRTALLVLAASAVLSYAYIGTDRLGELVRRQEERWSEVMQEGVQDDREIIREEIYDLIAANPLGYGIGEGPRMLGPRLWGGQYPEFDPHNQFLGVFLDCGVVGFLLYMLGHAMLLRDSWRSWKQGAAWPLAVLLAIEQNSLGHTTFMIKIVGIAFGLLAAAVRLEVPAPAVHAGTRRNVTTLGDESPRAAAPESAATA